MYKEVDDVYVLKRWSMFKRTTTFDEAITTLTHWAQDSLPQYISTCSVYMLMMCRENATVMEAVNSAAMLTADGMPIVWVQWRYSHAERVSRPDVMQTLCEGTAGTSVRQYFWGGLPGVADTLAQRLQTRHSDLQVSGTFSPPVSAVGDPPDPAVVKQ